MPLLETLDSAHKFLAEKNLIKAIASLANAKKELISYCERSKTYNQKERHALALELAKIYDQASKPNSNQTNIQEVMVSIENFKLYLLNPEELVASLNTAKLAAIPEDAEDVRNIETTETHIKSSNSSVPKKSLNPGWGKQSQLTRELLRKHHYQNTAPANDSSSNIQAPTPKPQ